MWQPGEQFDYALAQGGVRSEKYIRFEIEDGDTQLDGLVDALLIHKCRLLSQAGDGSDRMLSH